TSMRFSSYVDHSYIVTLEKYKKWIEGKADNVVYESYRNESANSVKVGLKALSKDFQADRTIVIQSPSDHYIAQSDEWKTSINRGVNIAKGDKVAIIGVKPERATDQYGYLKQSEQEVSFFEKPDPLKARSLIENGYLWNTAIYVYPLDLMIAKYI